MKIINQIMAMVATLAIGLFGFIGQATAEITVV